MHQFASSNPRLLRSVSSALSTHRLSLLMPLAHMPLSAAHMKPYAWSFLLFILTASWRVFGGYSVAFCWPSRVLSEHLRKIACFSYSGAVCTSHAHSSFPSTGGVVSMGSTVWKYGRSASGANASASKLFLLVHAEARAADQPFLYGFVSFYHGAFDGRPANWVVWRLAECVSGSVCVLKRETRCGKHWLAWQALVVMQHLGLLTN